MDTSPLLVLDAVAQLFSAFACKRSVVHILLRDTQFVPKVVTVPRPEHPATGVNVTASRRCRYIRIYSVTEVARYRTLTDHWLWTPNIRLNISSLKQHRRDFYRVPPSLTRILSSKGLPRWWHILLYMNGERLVLRSGTGLFMSNDFQKIFVKFDMIYCMWPFQWVLGC